jgi:hypothetical protein
MTHREELIDVSTRLALMRDDLVTAIAADQRRARRRRVKVAGSMVALFVLCSTAALAAATGLFSPAPPPVQEIFDGLNDGSGPAVDASHAVEIGVIDDHVAYAAPTEDGSFCLYFAPNPRSGPTGSACLPDPVEPGDIAFSPLAGHDGVFVFGRVGADDASSVEIGLPGEGGTATAQVAEDGFFLATLSQEQIDEVSIEGVFALELLESMTATARDQGGTVLAESDAPVVAQLIADGPGPTPTVTP